MNAPEIVLVLLVVRLVLPLSIMLWIGEKVQRRQLTQLRRMGGSL